MELQNPRKCILHKTIQDIIHTLESLADIPVREDELWRSLRPIVNSCPTRRPLDYLDLDIPLDRLSLLDASKKTGHLLADSLLNFPTNMPDRIGCHIYMPLNTFTTPTSVSTSQVDLRKFIVDNSVIFDITLVKSCTQGGKYIYECHLPNSPSILQALDREKFFFLDYPGIKIKQTNEFVSHPRILRLNFPEAGDTGTSEIVKRKVAYSSTIAIRTLFCNRYALSKKSVGQQLISYIENTVDSLWYNPFCLKHIRLEINST